MVKKRKKYGKMNLTLDMDFYQFLRERAAEEHLATSTFVKKYLMDHLQKNNCKEVEHEKK